MKNKPTSQKAKPISKDAVFKGSKTQKLKKTYTSNMSYDKGESLGDLALDNNTVNLVGAGVSLKLPDDAKTKEAYNQRIKDALNQVFAGNNALYSESSLEDIRPKPDDFVSVPFRLLSATIVAGGTWRATNFGYKPSVLKSSLKKLANKPVYPEHQMDVRNWVGMVLDPMWEDERKMSGYKEKDKKGSNGWNGMIPAGINGTIAVDMKADAKLARGMMLGSVYSNSVTVVFSWKPSHDTYKSEWEFLEAIGTIHEDGRMVTRDVTEIHDYYESSLVGLGADPFAKAVDGNGNLVNIDTSSVIPFSKENKEVAEQYKKEAKYSTDNLILSDSLLSLRRSENFNYLDSDNSLDTKKESDMDKVLAEILGVELEQLNKMEDSKLKDALSSKFIPEGQTLVEKESYESLTATLKDKEATIETLSSEKESLKADNEKLVAEKESLANEIKAAKPAIEFLDASRNEAREEIKKAHIAQGETSDEAFLKMVDEEQDMERLSTLYRLTKGKAMIKFGASCKKCGSDKLNFRKSEGDVLPDNTTVELADGSISDLDELRKIGQRK